MQLKIAEDKRRDLLEQHSEKVRIQGRITTAGIR
jgi:hypothetical protein